MKKSSKRLVISTHAKNKVGFRTRTEGIDLSGFNSNPLLLWMHKRPTGDSTTEVLPLGYWEDIQLNGEELSGVPVFDDKDDFAMKIYHKVENDTIRMASAGLEAKEFKEDENGDVWLWNSALFEASLCDIGSNPEALAVSLYNQDHEQVALSDVYQKTKIDTTMKIKLTATTATLLNLVEGQEMEASEAVIQLANLANGQKDQIVKLTKEAKDAKDALDKKDKEVAEAEKKQLLTAAIEKGKITKDQEPVLLKMETEDLKTFLNSAPDNKSVAEQLDNGKQAAGKKVDTLIKLSWDELDKSNQLTALKEADMDAFKEKYQLKFGKEYKG